MYVPIKYRVNTANEIDTFVKNINEDTLVWSDLLTIDYFYYNHEDGYDGGLSFIDRISKKLGDSLSHVDFVGLKQHIRGSDNPEDTYVETIKFLLADPDLVAYYGI